MRKRKQRINRLLSFSEAYKNWTKIYKWLTMIEEDDEENKDILG